METTEREIQCDACGEFYPADTRLSQGATGSLYCQSPDCQEWRRADDRAYSDYLGMSENGVPMEALA